MDKEAAKREIVNLIDDFEKNYDYYDKTDEANIETKLIEPLFAALGWTKDDFEKREKVKRKDRRGISDYMFKLQGKRVFVLEAKTVKVKVEWEKTAWKQAISYTLSNRVKFAVLTNFKNMLIFCTADENAMRPFRELKYSDYVSSRFDDLWLLSKESFEQNLIFDRAGSEERMKKMHTIDDELLEDMLLSRKNIVESIERNYPSKYSTIEKDDIAQRIFGRMVFIRKCEDKEINFDRDNKEIEHLTEVTLLPHNEAYPKLKKIFSKYNDAFDSNLFLKESDSDVDKIDIDGKAIKELVSHTYDSRDGNYIYNFEWIDADVLGSIYEQYLGHILKETAKRTSLKESYAHRKEQGIYYTPIDIVKYIADNTLGEILKDMKPAEVRKLKVLDPACGSGSFLIKAFDVLEDYYEKHPIEKQKRLDSTGDFYTVKEQVLVNNIHGVDLDHKAVEIAQLNLLLKVAEKSHRLPLLQKNIQNGNSLIDDEMVAGDKAFRWEDRFADIMKDGGFDVIIGNPPYERILYLENEKGYYSKKYVSAYGSYDILVLFIEKSIDLLKEDGYLGFIVSNKFLVSDYGKKLRELIISKCKIVQIVDLADAKRVFSDALVSTAIIILQKKKMHSDYKIKTLSVKKDMETVDSKLLEDIPFTKFVAPNGTFNVRYETEKDTIYSKINKLSKFGDVFDIRTGIMGFEYWNMEPFIHEEKKSSREVRIATNSYLDRYCFLWGKKINLYKKNFNNPYTDLEKMPINEPTRKLFLTKNKILIRGVAQKLTGMIDEEGVAFLVAVHSIISKDYAPKFVLGLVNSEFFNWIHKDRFYLGRIPEGSLKYPVSFLKELPAPKEMKYEKEVINLVDRMLSLNKKLAEFGDKNTPETARLKEERDKTDAQIDELVYKIYGINDEEKKIIKESLKS